MMNKLDELVEMAKEISSKKWFLNSDEEVTAIDNDAGPDDLEEAFIGCAANIQLAKYIAAANPESILAIAEAFRELEKERNAFESNYNGEIDLRKQIQNNWRRLAAASGWVDSRDPYAADNDLPRQFDSATEMAKSWKQRAEAAEAALERESDIHIDTAASMREWRLRAEAAEAQRAELANQKPDYFLNRIESSDNWGPETELRIYESQLDASKSKDDHGGRIIELFTRPAPAAVPVDLVPECKWAYDENDYFWSSACGEDWQFTDGGPKENRVKFCQGCGGVVSLIEGLK